MIGRDVIYRQTIKLIWKCRHSSAVKKGCWIQGNKTGKCLLTLCIPRLVTRAHHNVPGSVGTREGRRLCTNMLREPRCLGYPAETTSELSSSERKTSPPPSEKEGILRFQVCIVQYLPKLRIIIQLNSY